MGTETDPGRFITRPTVIMIFLICVFIYFIIPSRDYVPDEDAEEDSSSMSRRAKELKYNKGRNKDQKERGSQDDPNELVMGTKRFKLYEKQKMNYRRAESFCKKMNGKLAQPDNLEEMRRLAQLLQRASMVSDEMWMGVEKKLWKRHAWKDKEHPPGIDPEKLSGMSAMMMGGGKQEMCPSLSSSTRAIGQVMCLRDLPFVCEFDRFARPKIPSTPYPAIIPPRPRKSTTTRRPTTKGKKSTMRPAKGKTTTRQTAKRKSTTARSTRGKSTTTKPKGPTTRKMKKKNDEM